MKRPSWFRLSHDIFENPDFYSFNHAELLAWVYILCCASKRNTGTVTVNFDHAVKIGKLKERFVKSAIKKLVINQSITTDDTDTLRARDEDVTDADATDVRTYERTGVSSAELPTLAFLWNENSGSLPKVIRCSAQRKKQADLRLSEDPDQARWVEVIRKIASSDFCTGKNARGWRASFDFLLKPDTATKALEGVYDNKTAVSRSKVHFKDNRDE